MTETEETTTPFNKFKKSCVYAVRSPHTNMFYVGSTAQKLCNRWSNHMTAFKRHQDKKSNDFCYSFNIMLLGDAYIELLEDVCVDNKQQLTKREGEIQRHYGDLCVNRNIAGRTAKEWYKDNAEDRIAYQSKYTQLNKEAVAKYQKEYHKEYQKEYQNRPAEIKRRSEYNKKYYLKKKGGVTPILPPYQSNNGSTERAISPILPQTEEPLSSC